MTKGKLDYLVRQVDEEIVIAHRRRRKNRRMASLIRFSVILCTAAIPILLGFKVAPERATAFSNAALLCGALATALNAWEAFYGHKELWGVNTATWTQLVSLRSDLGYLVSGGEGMVADDVLDQIQGSLQQILAEANSAWIGVRQSTARQPSPQPIVPPHNQ